MSHKGKEFSNSGPIARFANPGLVAGPHTVLATIAQQRQIQLILMKSNIDLFKIPENAMMNALEA